MRKVLPNLDTHTHTRTQRTEFSRLKSRDSGIITIIRDA